MLAHNSASFIKTALDSVRGQTFRDWELLVSDDASTDGTGELVKPYLEDQRIRYVHHHENLKQANNWAFAIANTSAPILATLHADDAWESDALQTFADAFRERGDLDFVWANWDWYDSDLKVRQRSGPLTAAREMDGNDACAWLLEKNDALPSAVAFSREAEQRAGSPDPRFGMVCDRRYFLQLTMASRRCRAIPKVVMRYRRNEGGVTSVFSRSGRLQEEMIVFGDDGEQLFRSHPRGRELAKRLRIHMGKGLFLYGLEAILVGDRARGTKWIRDAVNLARWALLGPSTIRGVARTLKNKIVGAI